MASSIRLCTVKKCDEASCAVCHCCQKDLCLDHLKEHRDQLNSKLDPLVNRINTSMEILKHFDVKSSTAFVMIDQWRVAAHQIIDQFCDRLYNELIVEKANEPMKKLHTTRNKLNELIQKHGATRENIESLEKELCVIEQQIDALRNTQINLRPLVIDENTILLTNSFTNCFMEPNPTRSFQIFVKVNRLFQKFVTIDLNPRRWRVNQ